MKCKLSDGRRTTDAGQRVITIGQFGSSALKTVLLERFATQVTLVMPPIEMDPVDMCLETTFGPVLQATLITLEPALPLLVIFQVKQ